MQIFIDSMTGNVRRFAAGVMQLCGEQCGDLEVLDVQQHAPSGEYLLMTYTFGTGEVPRTTADFLMHYAGGLRGVVASGSFHWGANFGRAGDCISQQYGVPLVARINKAGSAADKLQVAEWLLHHLGSSIQSAPAHNTHPSCPQSLTL